MLSDIPLRRCSGATGLSPTLPRLVNIQGVTETTFWRRRTEISDHFVSKLDSEGLWKGRGAKEPQKLRLESEG